MGGYGPTVAASIMDRANEIHEDNKQKKDEARAHDISQLILERDEFANKIPTLKQGTPEYKEAYTALQGVNKDITDFYHPVRNPGAIEKFGHLLTDHMGITNPQKRQDKQEGQQQEREQNATKETDRQIAAAPLGPVQVAVQGAEAHSAAAMAGYQADLKSAETLNPDMSPDDKAALESELKEKYFGQAGKGNWTPVAGTIDGVATNLLFNKATHQYLTQGGSPLPPEMLEKFIPTAKETTASENIAGYKKAVEGGYSGSFPQYMAEQRRAGAPSTSAINEGREDYAKSHGFKGWSDIPDEYRDIAMNYEIRKQAMDKAYPTSSTVTSKALDAEGQFRTITVTNYKTPQGVETLKDPLWFLAPVVPSPTDGVRKPTQAATNTEISSTSTTPPANPKELKKEAQTRVPKSPASGSPNGGTVSAVGNTKISAPMFPGQNKDYSDTKAAYRAAQSRVETMEKSAKAAYGGDQQAMLSLIANHIGMTLGAQKGARINQSVWNEAVASAPWIQATLAKMGHFEPDGGWVLDQPFEGYKGGVTLTGEQIKSMVNLAHEQVDTLKHAVNRIQQELYKGSAVPPPSGGEGEWKPPAGAPDPSKYPDNHELYNKRTGAVDAVTKGGKWIKPPQK